MNGVVLRYGWFYGPGTAYAADGSTAELVRRRRFPILGGGDGVWSFIHLEDAAIATVAALDPSVAAAAYNVVDNEPALVRDWLRDTRARWARRRHDGCRHGSGASPRGPSRSC